MNWLITWLSDFLNKSHWLDKITVELVILAILVIWLGYERRKLREAVDYHVATLRQLILASEEASEGSLAPNAGQEALKSWQQIREIWADARERIEVTIENLDGRVRRKYAHMTRYSYDAIIERLRQDEAIASKAADALKAMNESFLALRPRPANSNAAAVKQFKQWYDQAIKGLPVIAID